MFRLQLLLLLALTAGAFPSPRKGVAFTHIPKTGGASLESALWALHNETPGGVGWRKRLGGHERCYDAMFDPNSLNVVLLRSPRSHVLSQFLECRYDGWGRGATRGITAFDELRKLDDTEAFPRWVAHFNASSWQPWRPEGRRADPNHLCRTQNLVDCHRDFNCYHPNNMQTRQISPACRPSPHHAYSSNYPITQGDLDAAATRLHSYDVVGVKELFAASWCLLLTKLPHRALPPFCYDADADVTLPRITHDSPGSAALSAQMAPSVWLQVDQLTLFDRVLFQHAHKRLLSDFEQFNKDATRKLGAHLLVASEDLSYLSDKPGASWRAPAVSDELRRAARLARRAAHNNAAQPRVGARAESHGNLAAASARSCARLQPGGRHGVNVLFNSLRDVAADAPGAGQHPPPFSCLMKACDADSLTGLAGPAFPEETACSWRFKDVGYDSRTACGNDYRGWALLWEDVVVGIPVSYRFARQKQPNASLMDYDPLDRLRKQSSADDADVWFDWPGVWLHHPDVRAKLNVMLLAECVDSPGTMFCPSAAVLDKLVSQFRSRGVQSVQLEVLRDERGRKKMQTRKTRALFSRMLAWRPKAHFFIKVDDDALLWPERLMHFLRTLEAAVGTQQPVAFGHRLLHYLQGHTYGLNRRAVQLLQGIGEDGWRTWMARNSRDHEDQLMGDIMAHFNVSRLHCGHFVANGESYLTEKSTVLRDANSMVLMKEKPKPRQPISLHKPGIFPSRMRASLPDRLCDFGDPEDWSC